MYYIGAQTNLLGRSQGAIAALGTRIAAVVVVIIMTSSRSISSSSRTGSGSPSAVAVVGGRKI